MKQWLFEASAMFGGIVAAYVVALVAEAIARHREARRTAVKPRSSW